MLEAAERHCDVAGVPAINPHETRLDLARGAVRETDVARPQPRSNAVSRVVGHASGVIRLLEAGHREDRTEYLLAGERRLRRHLVEHGRLDEDTATVDTDAPCCAH